MTAASTPEDPPLPGAPPGLPLLSSPADDMRAQMHRQLLARRTVMVDRPLDDGLATLVAAQLMALDADGTEPITLLVNSPGGTVDGGLALLDAMDLVRASVETTCLGQAVGTAAIVVAAGTGRRRAGGGARLGLRLADEQVAGPATGIEADVGRLRDRRAALIDRLVAVTGQDRRLIERDVDTGRSLTAAEAVAYGLVDEVLRPGT